MRRTKTTGHGEKYGYAYYLIIVWLRLKAALVDQHAICLKQHTVYYEDKNVCSTGFSLPDGTI
jgi:hypothetical protein